MTTRSDPSPIPTLLSTDQLAEHLGCSGRTICRMRERGLPAIHVGVLVRFDLADVRRWLEADGRVRGAPNDERLRQLSDIANGVDEDNAECAAADLDRESPPPCS